MQRAIAAPKQPPGQRTSRPPAPTTRWGHSCTLRPRGEGMQLLGSNAPGKNRQRRRGAVKRTVSRTRQLRQAALGLGAGF